MAVKQALLALLDEHPRYGYELKSEFDRSVGGAWQLNIGQVYTTLDRLERDGLVMMHEVTAGDDETQKYYELTHAGRAALTDWWQQVPSLTPPRDDLLLKILIAAGHSRDIAIDVISTQRTAITASLQRRRLEQRAATNGSQPHLASILANDALIRRAEADLMWLDRCEANVRAAPDTSFQRSDDDGSTTAGRPPPVPPDAGLPNVGPASTNPADTNPADKDRSTP